MLPAVAWLRPPTSSLLAGSGVLAWSAHHTAGVHLHVAARLLHRLQVEPRRPERVPVDPEDDHAPHEEAPGVGARTRHLPLGPELVPVDGVPRHVGPEISDGEEL